MDPLDLIAIRIEPHDGEQAMPNDVVAQLLHRAIDRRRLPRIALRPLQSLPVFDAKIAERHGSKRLGFSAAACRR
jgi:hypothetical protein